MWKTSTFCKADDPMCVEVELNWEPGKIGVSDSKDADGPVLVFTDDEWAAFVAGVKAGEFDAP
jgi:hypothetical protein